MRCGRYLLGTALTGAAVLLFTEPSYAAEYCEKCSPTCGNAKPIYASPEYGAPVTVPVAPTVHCYYEYQWGVPGSSLRCIKRQYRAGGGHGGWGMFSRPGRVYVLSPTPSPVTSTSQFGYYYARAPW